MYELIILSLLMREPLHGYLISKIINRSEEHTSELQSQSNLVCRLLLEKKNEADHVSGLELKEHCKSLIQQLHPVSLWITNAYLSESTCSLCVTQQLQHIDTAEHIHNTP